MNIRKRVASLSRSDYGDEVIRSNSRQEISRREKNRNLRVARAYKALENGDIPLASKHLEIAEDWLPLSRRQNYRIQLLLDRHRDPQPSIDIRRSIVPLPSKPENPSDLAKTLGMRPKFDIIPDDQVSILIDNRTEEQKAKDAKKDRIHAVRKQA